MAHIAAFFGSDSAVLSACRRHAGKQMDRCETADTVSTASSAQVDRRVLDDSVATAASDEALLKREASGLSGVHESVALSVFYYEPSPGTPEAGADASPRQRAAQRRHRLKRRHLGAQDGILCEHLMGFCSSDCRICGEGPPPRPRPRRPQPHRGAPPEGPRRAARALLVASGGCREGVGGFHGSPTRWSLEPC
ncbi:unnamed protein product [Prorocentrum cordatum]|uniref:Uncharacterized protein n=1 Tax=Prorocentrum cordatum TaxID=2364126 RepID=A0ABN9QYQ9_9DINO|nr:unnamed protein product [Polarella glacialis]